jgi:hypothetical protein
MAVKSLHLPLKHRHQPHRLPEGEISSFRRCLRHGFAHAIGGSMVHQDHLGCDHPFKGILRLQVSERRNRGRSLSVGLPANSRCQRKGHGHLRDQLLLEVGVIGSGGGPRANLGQLFRWPHLIVHGASPRD